MKVKIYRNIAEIDEAKWDAIVGKEQIFCTHKYVEVMERAGINDGRCYYPVIYDGDEIIAHACVYFIRTELDLFANGVTKRIIHFVRRKWKNFFILRSLECGPPAALGNTISFKNGVDCARVPQLLCQEIENLAKELGIKLVLFRDFYDEETKFCDLFKRRGYMKIHNLPLAKIKIRWKSFDEYLNSMRSNYRCKIIKSMDKCARANISIRLLKDFSVHYARELKRLYDNVFGQAKEIKREPLNEIFFQNIDKNLKEKSAVLLALKDDKPIGFMLLLFNDKELISALIGLDYDYNREYCIYFNLFYKAIELAIENGMDKIDMGITTLNPKRDMGSSVVALNMYMRYSNAFLNKIIPILFDMITPPDTTQPRNVFKEDCVCKQN